MKTIKFLLPPLLFFACLIIMIPFQSCEPDDDNECDTCTTVYKPNIYVYPKDKIQLTVTLGFPIGGEIVTSIPEYGDGWDVSVEPSGLIDNYFSYLFYESRQPYVWQTNEGWIIKRVELESFFRKNMTDFGFHGQEIQDFIDYWIPRFKNFEYYSIYPQTSEIIDDVIELSFSKQPDNLLRLFYVVKGAHNLPNNKLLEPTINDGFKRVDFFVTEWGVILN